jgi:dihydrofolate synthase/folylpolyglutamate synthase
LEDAHLPSSRAVTGSIAWLEGLSPWPEEFGLERMHALLAELGNPERRFEAVHVVGTNGKSTTTRMIEELLLADGLDAGAYLSPHVRGWSERIRVCGEEADIEQALARVRPAAERVGATQFEALTAAALAEFREAGVQAAAVEAGLGGRLDATNVLRSAVVVLTNVSLEHTAVLGSTRKAIAAEKLAVIRPGCACVLGEPEWEPLARENGAATVVVEPHGNLALARAAAECFLGHPVDPAPAAGVRLPGRLEWRGEEIWDGAHTPEAVRYLAARVPPVGAAVVSILRDKDVDGMLAALSELTEVVVATASSSPRALPADELARRARRFFSRIEEIPDPQAALACARQLARPVLVTGSLYLLADLAAAEHAAAAT